ncbi:MAG: glycosyl transferase [Paenibacillaceae bacterium]|jgi:glycosyltransferase involved in cell wall biosynthesis|nr:glycosyl transferase [Paenibacillaceae bacterium]
MKHQFPDGKNRISTVIITQDDEERIGAAIETCRSFSDEIVVIDGGSKDRTMQVAERLGCKVWLNPWPGYAKQRAYGIERAAWDWVFLIDTDEVVSDELAASILAAKDEGMDPLTAYELYRIGDFLGKWLDRGEYLVRFYNRSQYQMSASLVHEVPEVPGEHIRQLSGVLWHHGFRSIHDHVQRFNKYTDLEAQIALEANKPFSIIRLLYRPPARFIQKYIVHGLYKKGVPGLAVSFFWVMYEYMVHFKIYEQTRAKGNVKTGSAARVKEERSYAAR